MKTFARFYDYVNGRRASNLLGDGIAIDPVDPPLKVGETCSIDGEQKVVVEATIEPLVSPVHGYSRVHVYSLMPLSQRETKVEIWGPGRRPALLPLPAETPAE